jgi:hypothetical protein
VLPKDIKPTNSNSSSGSGGDVVAAVENKNDNQIITNGGVKQQQPLSAVSKVVHHGEGEKIRKPRDAAIREELAKMIIKDLQPVSILKRDGMVRFIEFALPGFVLNQRAICDLIEKKFEHHRSRLLADLAMVNSVCVTTDGWTQKSSLTVTLHYLDPNSLTAVFKSTFVDSLNISSGENIKDKIENTLLKWNIQG